METRDLKNQLQQCCEQQGFEQAISFLNERGIFADQEGTCTFFALDRPMIVYETKQYFNLLIENRKLYVIPKRVLCEEDIQYLAGLLQEEVDGFQSVSL